MTATPPCRRCERDAASRLLEPFRLDSPGDRVRDFFARTRMCAKCRVASKVYRHYSDKVFGQGRHDLQPCLEFACEKINGSHDEPGNWNFASGVVCGGCGYCPGTKKLPRVDKDSVFCIVANGGDLDTLRLPRPRDIKFCKDAGMCYAHIACINGAVQHAGIK